MKVIRYNSLVDLVQIPAVSVKILTRTDNLETLIEWTIFLI